MNDENLKEIQKIAKIFSADKIITTTEIDQVLKGIMSIMASFRQENVKLTEENKAIFNSIMSQIEAKYGETITNLDNKDVNITEKFNKEIAKVQKKFDKEIKKAKAIITELQSIEVKDGEDADEQRIISEVLSKIKLPENKNIVLDTPEQLRDKLESLEDEEALDVFKLKNISSLVLKKELEIMASNFDVAIARIRPSREGGSGGVEVFSSGTKVGSGSALNFVGATVSNTDGHTTTITVTGGSIGGSITGGTEGSVLFLGVGGVLAQDNANFFWDDTNNRLGIGTTSPSNTLHVKNLSDNPVLVEGANGNTYLSGYSLDFTRNSANYIWAKTSGGDLRFTVNGNAIGSASMIISNAGNVGIGTTSPSELLHLSGSSSADRSIRLDRNISNANGQYYIKGTTVGGGDALLIASGNSLSGNYAGIVYMGASNKLGLGTVTSATPQYAVTFGKNESQTGAGGYAFFGTASSLTWTQTSTNGNVVGTIDGSITYAGTGALGNARLVNATATITNTGGSTVRGGYFSTRTSSTGTATFMSGVTAELKLSGTGDVTDGVGYEVSLIQDGAKTTTNLYGIKVLDLTNSAGTITNTYGIYTGDLTAGTQTNQAYNIYLSDANARNYIAGDTTFNNKVINTSTVRLKGYTVATLPTGTTGDTAYVTDAVLPTYLGALTGGGSVVTPVFYNGTAWVSY